MRSRWKIRCPGEYWTQGFVVCSCTVAVLPRANVLTLYWLFTSANRLYKMCQCYFFLFNGPFGDQSSQNAMDRSSPNFQNMYIYGWARSIRPSFCDRSRDVTMVTDFGENRRKFAYPTRASLYLSTDLMAL